MKTNPNAFRVRNWVTTWDFQSMMQPENARIRGQRQSRVCRNGSAGRIRSTDYELDEHQLVAPSPCDVVEEVERGKNVVPHFLPGTNPSLKDFAVAHNLPEEATRGGAATMYPEYRSKLATMPTVGKK